MKDADLFRSLYLCNFSSFLRYAFAELHPGVELLESWHVDVLADSLEGCLEGKTKRLIINLPPRYLKSFCASICFPVWALARDPTLKIMVITGNGDLGRDLRQRIMRLVQTPRFRALFPHLRFDDRRRDLILRQGGSIAFGAVGGTLIGRGADIVVIDDPQSPREAADPRARDQADAWYDREVIPRLDKASGIAVLVMQRLHQSDLAGYLLRAKGAWAQLCLPAIALEDEVWPLSSGVVHRRKKGEPLHPAMEDRQALWDVAKTMGACGFSAQYLQRPLPLDNPTEQRNGNFQHPRPPDWVPGMDEPHVLMGSVSELWFLRYDVFGEGEPPPRQVIGYWPEVENWEEVVLQQQTRLFAEERRDREAREQEGRALAAQPSS